MDDKVAIFIGIAGKKHTMDLTEYVREIATSKYVNCGLMLRTKSESKASNFTQFYNSRFAASGKSKISRLRML